MRTQPTCLARHVSVDAFFEGRTEEGSLPGGNHGRNLLSTGSVVPTKVRLFLHCLTLRTGAVTHLTTARNSKQMKKRTVITTEKREVWVISEGSITPLTTDQPPAEVVSDDESPTPTDHSDKLLTGEQE